MRVSKSIAEKAERYEGLKAPQHIRFIAKSCQGLAHKFGCEIEGRIAIKDKETGKVWR